MSTTLTKHLSRIGRRGGLRSRRRLASETARLMVRIREARRAFRKFHATCFWSCDPEYLVTAGDVAWVIEGLRKNGNRAAWEVAARLGRSDRYAADTDMPLTPIQAKTAGLLAVNRSPDSHLAGGAALHFAPNSKRYSNDLGYFHDSVERVATAFQSDRAELERNGFSVEVEMNQPGYLRALVSFGNDRTKIEWAHDSAWRFMPAMHDPDVGFRLHPIDIAVNKVLALAGRDEPRDFLDILYINREILALGPLCWAAAGKDPGFSPASLLELLKRRGRYRPEDFSALMITDPIDLPAMKTEWLRMLDEAEAFIRNAPPDQIGCLYYSRKTESFVDPQAHAEAGDIEPHYGRPGGVLPRFYPGEPFPRSVGA